MRRVLSTGLAVIAGVVALPVGVSPRTATVNQAAAADHREDPRAEPLRRFFHKSDCPAQEYTQAFLEVADRYALDWRLLPSISFVESTGGKTGSNNNLFGWDSGRAQFPSPAAGIHAVGYRLAHSGLYRNKNLDQLLATYNPEAAYAQRIKSVMRRIAPAQ